jgi:hypothetical protein
MSVEAVFGDSWGQKNCGRVWKTALPAGLTHKAKDAQSPLFMRVFRIHPKICEIVFEASTPSVGTMKIKGWMTIS